MLGEWEKVKLADVCSIKSSKRIFAKEYVEIGVPFTRSKDVIDKSLGSFTSYDLFISEHRYREITSKYGSPKKGDLLINSVGNRSGQPYVIEDEGDFYFKDGNILWLNKFKNLDALFLSYWFKSPIGQWTLESVMIGSAQKAITIDSVRNLEIELPPLSEQKRIAHILGTLDDKIELNRKMNATLEAMAQALFKSWFVDFDPVIDNALRAGTPIPEPLQARAETRQKALTENNNTPAPHDHLFPNTFTESEDLGWIPEGWDNKPLDELIILIGGGTPKTSIEEYWNGDIPWFSVVDAPRYSDVFVIDTNKKITTEGVNNSSTKVLRSGTTIISARGTVGKCALVGTKMAMNQSCYGILGADNISDEYIYYSIRHYVSDLQQRGHGSVFNTITRDTFKSINVPFSSTELTQVFSNQASNLLVKIKVNLHQQTELTKLREALLPILLSGKLSPT